MALEHFEHADTAVIMKEILLEGNSYFQWYDPNDARHALGSLPGVGSANGAGCSILVNKKIYTILPSLNFLNVSRFLHRHWNVEYSGFDHKSDDGWGGMSF